MGAYAPVSWVSEHDLKKIEKGIINPALDGLKNSGHPFIGVLYPGLKFSSYDQRVLKFNARFGDPETQVYMRLLETDLLDIIEACVNKELKKIKISWKPGFAVCVVLVSANYPEAQSESVPIYGLEKAKNFRSDCFSCRNQEK